MRYKPSPLLLEVPGTLRASPTSKQGNHPSQETAGGLAGHPSARTMQGMSVLKKESLLRIHIPPTGMFFFFGGGGILISSFLLFLPCTVGMGGERRQFPCLCSYLAHAFAFPTAFLWKAPLPQPCQGRTPSRWVVPALAQPGSKVGVIQLSTHTALGFKLNKPCKELNVELKCINEVACGIQWDLRNFLAWQSGRGERIVCSHILTLERQLRQQRLKELCWIPNSY